MIPRCPTCKELVNVNCSNAYHTPGARRARLVAAAATPEAMDVLNRLFAVAGVDEALDRKTDAEIARLVEVWAWSNEMGALSPQHILLLTVRDRLRRAGGGPMPETKT